MHRQHQQWAWALFWAPKGSSLQAFGLQLLSHECLPLPAFGALLILRWLHMQRLPTCILECLLLLLPAHSAVVCGLTYPLTSFKLDNGCTANIPANSFQGCWAPPHTSDAELNPATPNSSPIIGHENEARYFATDVIPTTQKDKVGVMVRLLDQWVAIQRCLANARRCLLGQTY